ncbi:TetR/AcrR family transcriptional regulator [Nocardia callitridis]|uniref:TetR/AcrR family transcriptional regulator C-terminal domain-containing protein n=1 Tax=Nocardia callitridis TaxID=648753 RepID=A0ABP9L0J7_9NOCA
MAQQRETLTRERVLDAALDLIDTQGLTKVSMRRLAASVGVEAMSLYNHVHNKRDLFDGVAARVFEQIPLPDPQLPWQQRIRALCASAHECFTAHPNVVGALAAGQANPRSARALRFLDALLAALLDAGLDERTAVLHYRSLMAMLFGSVMNRSTDITSVAGEPEEPVTEWFSRTVTPDQLPSLHRALPALLDIECHPGFDNAVEIFLAGIQNNPGTNSPTGL